MPAILDITPLRSLVAVDECGSFSGAAASLHVSQAGVSQHLRRLEAAVGHRLVERHGRGSRFTPAGERLLERARRILALHDETLEDLGAQETAALTLGCTEHAAAQLLPRLTTALTAALPGLDLRFRIDRGARLRDDLAAGTLDLALLLDSDDPRAVPAGALELTWYAAPGPCPPSGEHPVAVVAFDDPCALRTRALDALSTGGIAARIGAEAPHLAGVQAAVGAGLGVALMATLGQTPAGLVERPDLPRPEPVGLSVSGRRGLPPTVLATVGEVVADVVAAPRPAVAA